MNSNEAKIQLNSLIEHFKHGGLDFNATDISAIEILLDENKKYKEVIDKIKSICDKVPYSWSICGIDVVHKIDKVLKEVEHEKSNN